MATEENRKFCLTSRAKTLVALVKVVSEMVERSGASRVAQLVKNPLAMQETLV